ncbi:hypothetical protein Poli38472_014249 [Pythium oligandrum]|uniref:BZIP domain-containing protein n=1 Tax=Pythium oligandrum TaxID=41045 RepID=A0A8K1CIN2_PYTOL|nr:hypothetical protein Poli38472_014249 [Pythium oligandrum]|eukprot:TMW64132.1 hypothetical protein Poli38472_014249 [Pythium oligandrum]
MTSERLLTPPRSAQTTSLSPSDKSNDLLTNKALRRREQNRLSAQRSYHKKQGRLQGLRDQVQQLETQYDEHMFVLTVAGEDVETVSRREAHVKQLERVLEHRRDLQREHDELIRELDEHVRFGVRLENLAVQNAMADSTPTSSRFHLHRPLTADECHEIGRKAYNQIRRYRFPQNAVSTGASIFGWRDKRVEHDGMLKFALSKFFPQKSPYDVAMNSWRALSNPKVLQEIYSNNMRMYCELAQRIDDTNVVMYQEYDTPEVDPETGKETGYIVVVQTLLLFSLFQTETGFMLVFYSLSPDRIGSWNRMVDVEDPDLHRKRIQKEWLHKFSWCTWDAVGDDKVGTECLYLFTVPSEGPASAHWPIEIILMVMRYENATVGPIIVLPPSEDAVAQQTDDVDDVLAELLEL